MQTKAQTTKYTKVKFVLLALLVMALWGSLYPMVKIGYQTLGIRGGETAEILMYSGLRFFLCGAVMSGMAFVRKDKISVPKRKSIVGILGVGLFAIALNYAFVNVGLSLTDSSKTAILKQLGGLLYVCFAFLFFKSEKFSVWKMVGAAVGFAGIVAINFSGAGLCFSVGDILIIFSSVCTVAGSVFNKKIAAENSPFWITGISQLVGGALLMIAALAMGADMLIFGWASFGVFLYLGVASTLAYLLWSYILKSIDLSNMFIIKFAEPLFACLFGAILLQENIWHWQYLLAFVLVSAGIAMGHITQKERRKKGERVSVDGKDGLTIREE